MDYSHVPVGRLIARRVFYLFLRSRSEPRGGGVVRHLFLFHRLV